MSPLIKLEVIFVIFVLFFEKDNKENLILAFFICDLYITIIIRKRKINGSDIIKHGKKENFLLLLTEDFNL